ncbi:hypothetical protein ACIRVI_13995 [[Kitasatospora] papulosa]|uniref:hypothetical protein n=1 Tax=Streptomyces TaxID=1883 RepID=UPI0004CC8E67|nr:MULTISPECIES: hypothetical protein [Streptomyces]QBR09133.1 hypothetical protein D7Y56_26355 [Streptomyces sp. S501]
MKNGISRRTVVRSAAVLGAMTAAGFASAAPASALGTGARDKKAPSEPPVTTPNGWPVQANTDRDTQVWTRAVSGTGLSVPVWIGAPEAILLHVVRRYHYEVEGIRREELVGWQAADGLEAGAPESNLSSGTAVRVRPGASARGSLFPLQETVVRDILADCGGVVRWGADDTRADESLFYLDAGPRDPRVDTLAERIRLGEATPGRGAGGALDPYGATRRGRAERLADAQRTA